MVSENLQKVFITGADKGLGLALVSRFLRAGWLVFAGIHASADNLGALTREHGQRLVCVPLDVTSMASVVAALQQVSGQTPTMPIACPRLL